MLDCGNRKFNQLSCIGELLDQRSMYDDDFTFGSENMRGLASLIMDTAQEALDCLDGKRPTELGLEWDEGAEKGD